MPEKISHNYLLYNDLFISLENPEMKRLLTGISTFAIRTNQRTYQSQNFLGAKELPLQLPKRECNAQPTLNDKTHYNKTLGAVNVFDQRMVIEPKEAFKLIMQYFPELKKIDP